MTAADVDEVAWGSISSSGEVVRTTESMCSLECAVTSDSGSPPRETAADELCC